MKKLFNDGVLLDLQVHFWSFQASLRAEDLGIKEEDVPELFTLGRKRLFSKEICSSFASLRALADYYLEKYSFAFPVGKSRFIPYKALPDALKNLKQLRGEFEAAVAKFLDNYDHEREVMLEQYKQYASVLEKKYYPSAEKIAKKFSFDWVIFEVGDTQPMTDKKLLKEFKEREILDAEVQEYQGKLQQKLDTFLESAVGNLREEAAKFCKVIVDKIDGGGNVSEKSITAFREYISKFKTLNFVDDTIVEATLDSLSAKLTSSKDINGSTTLQDMIKKLANELISAAQNVEETTAVIANYKKRKLAI